MRCEHLEGVVGEHPKSGDFGARIENEREGVHGHGAQFRREGVPGFQTHYPVTMDTSNAARASNLKYGFRRFSSCFPSCFCGLYLNVKLMYGT